MEIRIFDILLPREVAFFGYLNEQALVFHEACRAFEKLVAELDDLPEDSIRSSVSKIKDYEIKGDEVERMIVEALEKSFITPIDREDIHAIAINIDHSLDLLDGASQKLQAYRIRSAPPNIMSFARMIVDISAELQKLIRSLEEKNGSAAIMTKIRKLEHEADYLFNQSLGALFDTNDPIEIIKLKAIYEQLEEIVNSVQHVGKLVSGIIVKHG